LIRPSRKLSKLPPYIFSRIKSLTQEAYSRRLDVIDLGMGNPDLPTPGVIVEALADTVLHHPRTHRYPQAKGMLKFRRAVCRWMDARFSVRLNPETEVVALVGSKEGIYHLCAAYLEPGDTALVPTPTYPVHYSSVILAGGRVHPVTLDPAHDYLPRLKDIPAPVARRAKILFLNYPNNPTAGVVRDRSFFHDVVKFAKKYGLLVVYDNAYSEITFDGYVAPSFLETPGARDVCVEFHSFSKSYNMAGWRLGWACGSSKLLAPLEKFKSYVDYGVPSFIQLAGVKALESWPAILQPIVETYQKRRDFVVEGLGKLGWLVTKPSATMYVWAALPEPFRKMGSLAFAERLVRETGIAVAPGVGFGEAGEGYVRFALVTHDQRFHDVLVRLKRFLHEK
jgi:LL-diaminopimelate aminotransferase